MSQNKLAKLRNTDVFKAIMRVLDEYRIPKEDFAVIDKRPHPMLTVRYCGQERELTIPSTPKTKGKAPVAYSAQLRRVLKEMQMAAIGAVVSAPVVQEVIQMQEQSNLPLFQHQASAGSAEITMSSREIAELVSSRHDSVKRAIERLAERRVIGLPPLVEYLDSLGRAAAEYRIGKRDSYVIVAQLSPEFTARLVDRWQELEDQQRKPVLTPAEMFLQNAQAMVAIERQQAQQAADLKRIDARMNLIEEMNVLKVRPQNSESITHIRDRIGKRYGLPEWVINDVMRQMPYSPKPAGMVKNSHEKADGSSYAVFWIQDVTKLFDRFVSECTRVTPTKARHPFVTERFTLLAECQVEG